MFELWRLQREEKRIAEGYQKDIAKLEKEGRTAEELQPMEASGPA
jgi:hypothetical protein